MRISIIAAAVAAIAVTASVLVTASAASGITYIPADQVQTAFQKGAVLLNNGTYQVHASRRDAAGLVEVHVKDTDIIYMLEGTTTFVTGGTLVGGKTTDVDEIRGTDVTGGQTRILSKGDVIVVPNGTPHWFKEVPGPVLYYVVKVR